MATGTPYNLIASGIDNAAAAKLRVVRIDNMHMHEYYNPNRVAKLADRLAHENVLANPPVVIEWQEKYIVLDGATRTNAFIQLGWPYIVVQVASHKSKDIKLHTWHHAVCGPEPERLLSRIRGLPSIEVEAVSHNQLQQELLNRTAICAIVALDGNTFIAHAPHQTANTPSPLQEIVNSYTEISNITRTINDDLETLTTEAPDLCALIVFPQFTLREVIDAAISKVVFPAGITRFMIPGRVLRLNISIERLRSHESLASKNAWLNKILAEKLILGTVRYYQESVILLDE